MSNRQSSEIKLFDDPDKKLQKIRQLILTLETDLKQIKKAFTDKAHT